LRLRHASARLGDPREALGGEGAASAREYPC
jgi:hypothetical protein